MSDLLSHLNTFQRQAVEQTTGPLLIFAGPGTGKTKTITHRIVHLMTKHQVPGNQILAVTFTNKAASEMSHRVGILLKEAAGKWTPPVISTFHSFCVKILKKHIEQLNSVKAITLPYTPPPVYSKHFTIYDADEQRKVVTRCIKRLDLKSDDFNPANIQAQISRGKNYGYAYTEFLAAAYGSADEFTLEQIQFGKVFAQYETWLQQSNALDFDDLLFKTVTLLQQFPQIAQTYSDQFKYIMVDEYQDTNTIQIQLLKALTCSHQNICVVGDPDQSIYSFRSANIQNIFLFPTHFPGAKTISLTENYRSTKAIVSATNALIMRNQERKPAQATTNNQPGKMIEFLIGLHADDEALHVAEKIQGLLQVNTSLKKKPSNPYIAIIYRTNYQSRVFEDALRRYRIPYKVIGGLSFFDRMEIKNMLAYIRLALNPHDDQSILRVINTPPRGIGQKTLDLIEAYAFEHQTSWYDTILKLIQTQSKKVSPASMRGLIRFYHLVETLQGLVTESPGETIRQIADSSGYLQALREEKCKKSESIDRAANVEELVNFASLSQERNETLADFLLSISLMEEHDSPESNSETESPPVVLVTAHGSKGLEFDFVFVVGVEEELFPHFRAIQARKPKELEEERRLFFVALTRAKQALYLSMTSERQKHGNIVKTQRSRFLDEIPSNMIFQKKR